MHLVQLTGNPVAALHRLQHGIVLHRLLHQHLDVAFLFSDVLGHLPHLTGNQLTNNHKQRCQHQQNQRQKCVHPLHEDKGTYQLQEGHNKICQYSCCCVTDGLNVLFQSGGDIAGVHLLLTEDIPAEDMTKDSKADVGGL